MSHTAQLPYKYYNFDSPFNKASRKKTQQNSLFSFRFEKCVELWILAFTGLGGGHFPFSPPLYTPLILSSYHKLWFLNPYIFATRCRRPLLFQTINIVWSNSLNYQKLTWVGCKLQRLWDFIDDFLRFLRCTVKSFLKKDEISWTILYTV